MDGNVNIPVNWERIKVEDISLRIHYGYTASSTTKNTGVKLLRITDIQEYNVNWSNVPFCEIEPYDVDKFLLEADDIVFARTGATVGKCFLIKGEIPKAVFASYLIRIQLSKNINPKYLYYYFQSADYWKQIGAKAVGIGQPNVNAVSLSNISLFLSPRKEQDRIVEKIEELFSKLDKAREYLLIALKQIKTYKESILNQLLLQKYDDSNKRKEFCLGDVVLKISKKVQPDKNSELRFIGLDSVEPNSLKPSLIHDFKDFSSAANYFDKGHILYSRMRPYLNKVIKAEFSGAASGEYIVLECKDLILNDYLKYVLHTRDFVNYANQRSSGDRPRVSFEDIATFRLYLGSIEEQTKVVNDIENKFTHIENVEQTVNNIEDTIVKCRQSILKKAFAGQLKTNDITDESIFKLLEDVKHEKNSYLEAIKNIKKTATKRIKMIEKSKTILTLLEESDKPVSANELWLQSIHSENIEEFYEALKKIQDKVVEVEKGFLSLKK